MAKKKIDTIPLESIIKIEVSGHFYARIQQMILGMANEKPQEEFLKVLKKLESNTGAESLYEYNLHTLMSLAFEIESQAKAQNIFTEEEIDIPEDGTDIQ